MSTLPELVTSLAARGDRPFLASGDEARGAAAFAREAEALARGLVGLGIARGERVAIWLEKSVAKALAILACGLAGAVSVIVNQKLKDAQLAHVLADAEPALVIASEAKLALLADPQAALGGRRVLLTGSREWKELFAARGALPRVEPTDPATILYTSGSTGLPKGIVQSHRSLHDGARIVAGYLGLAPRDHLLAILPLSFDYGLNQLLAAMHAGCRITLLQYFALPEVVETLARERCTGLAGVPVFWGAFCAALRTGHADPARLGALRYVTSSGGRLALPDIRTLRETLPWVSVFSMYGLSEAFRSACLPPAEIDRIPLSIGKAIPEVELLVIDPANGRACAPGITGELVHAGALLADGYWRRPADSARVFRAHPFDASRRAVWSGDLVRRDADGFFFFEGRRDAQLKIAGYRVSPDEVEQELRRVPGVALACAFGAKDPHGGDLLIACVTPAPDAPPDLDARVLRHVQRAAPSYLVPAKVHVVATPPLNANGKLDAGALARSLGYHAERRDAP